MQGPGGVDLGGAAPPIYDRYRLAVERPKFRGCWSPSLPDPTVRSFAGPSAKPAPRAAPKPAPAPAPAPVREVKKQQIVTPDNCLLNILDRKRDFRSFITKDGTCKDKYGNIIGYINIDEGTVGSPSESYWGQILEEQILDKDDKQIGELDMGRAWVKDHEGNTIAELCNSGEARGHDGSFIGQFQGFTYKDMKTVALYLIIVDPLMYNTIEG